MQNCRAQAPLPGLTSENRNFVSSTSSRSGCADPRVAVAPQIAPVISELVRPAQAVCRKVTIEPTGLWVFSSDRGKNNRDWEKILGVAELGPAGKAGGQRAKLTAAAKSMPSMLRDDTGLYDTILASYESALADFKEGSGSVVIVITDGENDDPTGGLSEKSLITKLKAAQDDKRPVRLVLIGMGPSTDVQAMRRVTGAMGGHHGCLRLGDVDRRQAAPEVAPRHLIPVRAPRGGGYDGGVALFPRPLGAAPSCPIDAPPPSSSSPPARGPV